MIAPMVLLDERPLPDDLAAELLAGPLLAPAHWPAEVGNMLLVAHRRRRLDTEAWGMAFGKVARLRVEVSAAADMNDVLATARLAERYRLTLYDAAYLHEAIVRSASLATLDADLIGAARERGVAVLTYP